MKNIQYIISGGELKPVLVKSIIQAGGRFPSGHIPWNKGKKGLKLGGEKTQFKPGHLPANTKYDGYISRRFHSCDNRYYLYIRVCMGKFILLHKFNWESVNGAIPKGYILRFIDGNSENCEVSNLHLVSKQEHMNLNRNYVKGAETMRKLWRSEKIRVNTGLPKKTKLRVK